jgi:arylsulfatase A-like enzyme
VGLFAVVSVYCSFSQLLASEQTGDEPSNVLMIVVDDLSDFVTRDGSAIRAKTPNLDRLRSMGVDFSDAHANSPICGPSRASFLYGYLPSTIGYYGYMQNRRAQNREYPLFQTSRNLMQRFRDAGYLVAGTGKIDHHTYSEDWDEGYWGVYPDYGPLPAKEGELVPRAHPNLPAPLNQKLFNGFGRLSDFPVFDGERGQWIAHPFAGKEAFPKPYTYNSSDDRDLMPDELSADWVEDFLQNSYETPFFLALGFVRPHAPHYLPDNYFDAYESISAAVPEPNYPLSVPAIARSALTPDDWGPDTYKNLTQTAEGSVLPSWIGAYLGSTTFMDDQLGVVLDALESSAYADNTIVVLFSDHGYHLGSHERVFKNSLWQEGTKVPLILAGPGIPSGARSERLASLVDVYPTLVELCGLPAERLSGERELDGRSLMPNVILPNDWGSVSPLAVFSAGTEELDRIEKGMLEDQHIALIDSKWRYIRYSDGTEELWSRNGSMSELPVVIGPVLDAVTVLEPFRKYYKYLQKRQAE